MCHHVCLFTPIFRSASSETRYCSFCPTSLLSVTVAVNRAKPTKAIVVVSSASSFLLWWVKMSARQKSVMMTQIVWNFCCGILTCFDQGVINVIIYCLRCLNVQCSAAVRAKDGVCSESPQRCKWDNVWVNILLSLISVVPQQYSHCYSADLLRV